MERFVRELRRRRVPQVLALYMACVFGIAEGVDLVLGALALPEWILTTVVVAGLVGFPVVAVVAWVFDLTPGGLARTPAPEGEAPFRWSVGYLSLSTVVLAALLGAGWFTLAPRQADPGRVAVLPLENRTGDPALDPLGEIAADWIVESLVRTGFVEVVDMASVLHAGGLQRAGPPAGVELQTGAGTLVTGSYYREGERLLFQVRISRADGTLIEALQPIRGPVLEATRGLGELRDRVLSALAAHHDRRLAGFEGGGGVVPSYEAYEAYLEGLNAYLRNDWQLATDRFRAAADADTTFARALLWAAASASWGNLSWADSAWQRTNERLSELSPYDRHRARFLRAVAASDYETAYRHARSMMEASPGSDDALREMALSALRTWRLEESLELLDRLDPDRGLVAQWPEYWFFRTLVLEQLGRVDEALATAREGRRRHPVLPTAVAEAMVLASLGRVDESIRIVEASPFQGAVRLPLVVAMRLEAAGHAEEAASVYTRAVEQERRRGGGEPIEISARAWILYLAGRYEESRSTIDSVGATLSASGGTGARTRSEFFGLRGLLALRVGDQAGARAWLDSLDAEPPHHGIGPHRARILVGLGARDEAVRALGLVYDSRTQGTYLHDPDLAPLRGYPAFERAMRPRRD